MNTVDTYFDRGEVSNSDIGALFKEMCGGEQLQNVEAAYRFGNLVDARITEPEKVNMFNHTVLAQDGVTWVQYTKEEFDIATEMKKSAMRDPFVAAMIKDSEMQKVMNRVMDIEYLGINFSLPVRNKWDLWLPKMGWGGDIKSTAATTQKQFEDALEYFDYNRQRAWYMDIANAPKDVLIGISKKNFKVFKVFIKRGDERYERGKARYQELSFKWWSLFSNFFNNTKDASPFMGSMLGEEGGAVMEGWEGAAPLFKV
jgi:hypothetical protein